MHTTLFCVSVTRTAEAAVPERCMAGTGMSRDFQSRFNNANQETLFCRQASRAMHSQPRTLQYWQPRLHVEGARVSGTAARGSCEVNRSKLACAACACIGHPEHEGPCPSMGALASAAYPNAEYLKRMGAPFKVQFVRKNFNKVLKSRQ